MSELNLATPNQGPYFSGIAMSQDDDHVENIIGGALLGALCGGGLGLGACMFVFGEPPLFTGDTILIGAVLCGVLGYFLGQGFVDWLKESWWRFW